MAAIISVRNCKKSSPALAFRRKTISELLLLGAAAALVALPFTGCQRQATTAEPSVTQASAEQVASQNPIVQNVGDWSKPVNGLQGRLILKRAQVLNATPIISATLELLNVENRADAMRLLWETAKKEFHVVDATGSKFQNATMGFYDGWEAPPENHVLPYNFPWSLNLSINGLGISRNKAAIIDVGSNACWEIERDGKHYFFKMAIESGPTDDDQRPNTWPWHGRLELPAVEIPTAAPKIADAEIGKLIDQWGPKLLDRNSDISDEAARVLSCIDDDRVVPSYCKALATNSYSLKCAALDRLAEFNTDVALTGLKKGMNTQGSDIGNCSNSEVAASCADNIRHAAAVALSISSHPEAKPLLLSMWNDPSTGVRITVLHELGHMDTDESLELLKKLSTDKDESVQNEALRCIKLRTEKSTTTTSDKLHQE